MTPYTAFVPNSAFALLLQGPPGSGKTTTALNFPDAYVLNCDQNLDGPVSWHKKNNPDWKGFYGYDTIETGPSGFATGSDLVASPTNWLRVVESSKSALRDPQVRTFIADGLTKLGDYLTEYVISKKATTEDRSKMTIGDWGPFKRIFTQYIAMLRSSGKHIVLCCHEKVDADEIGGTLGYIPNFGGSLANSLGGLFTDVWRCEVDIMPTNPPTYKNFLRTRKTPRLDLKCSREALPARLEFHWPTVAAALGLVDNKTVAAAK